MAKPNPALVSYIEKHLSKGVDIKRIKQKLSEVGHPIEAIEEAASFVTQQKPALKKKPTRFMIVYGIILILVLSAGGYFVWLKAMQQREYTQVVEQIETTKSYQGMTDIALLKLAAAGDMDACKFIKDHNIYYACTGKYWMREDCAYESIIGSAGDCWSGKAVESKNFSLCLYVTEPIQSSDCFTNAYAKIMQDNSLIDCQGSVACLNFILNNSLSSRDKSFCDLYPQVEGKDSCLSVLASERKDSSLCKGIYRPETKVFCLRKFISNLDDAFRVCGSETDSLVAYFSAQNISSDALLDLDTAIYSKLYCFNMVALDFVEKDIYTCGQMLDFVDSKASGTYLVKFKEAYGQLSTSSKAKSHAKYYGCLF